MREFLEDHEGEKTQHGFTLEKDMTIKKNMHTREFLEDHEGGTTQHGFTLEKDMTIKKIYIWENF